MKSIGVITPYDFKLDRELWRWAGDVDLHITRTARGPVKVGVSMARFLSQHKNLTVPARALSLIHPDVITYACASGSFVHGVEHEREMCETIEKTAGVKAMTAAGSMLRYLDLHNMGRLAVVTPYPLDLAAKFSDYLTEGGKTVTQSIHFEKTEHIWETDYQRIFDAALGAVTGSEDALLLACTNLPTYDIIGPLETELGIPVISTNRVMISDALTYLGEL